MPGTFSQIYIQYVFSVRNRKKVLKKPWRDELFKYMSGIITNNKQKSIIVNGVEDHVHVFVGLKPAISVADLIQKVKSGSSNFVREQGFVEGKFHWQEGYGAFSYGHSQIERVYNYILNQEEHHREKTFKKEYIEFLEKFEVPYDERHVFD